MKLNGLVPEKEGITVPAPLSVIVTPVALPPNVFPLTVIASVLQVLPEVLLKTTVGGFTQPQDISKLLPVVVHPDEFLTVRV